MRRVIINVSPTMQNERELLSIVDMMLTQADPDMVIFESFNIEEVQA